MSYPADCRYTKSHEWIKVEGNRVRLGITEHAQGELGDIVFVELPSAGTAIQKGENLATVESVKAVGDVSTPVSGKVIEINSALESSPETINASPHADGWLVLIEMQSPADLDDTMDATAYESFLRSG